MWVQRTADEVREVRRTQRKQLIQGAAFFGGFAAAGVTVVHSLREWIASGSLFAAPSEMPQRIPSAIVFGMLVAGAFYLLYRRQRPNTAVVCPGCESVQNEVAGTVCSCGGGFERMEDLKWIGAEQTGVSPNGVSTVQQSNSKVRKEPLSVA